MRRTQLGILGILVSASLLLPSGRAWAAEPQNGPEQAVDGANQVGQGIEQTTTGVGNTVTEDAQSVGKRVERAGQGADTVADRLHDGAKGFGEALLDGIKFVGRKIAGIFSGSQDKSRE